MPMSEVPAWGSDWFERHFRVLAAQPTPQILFPMQWQAQWKDDLDGDRLPPALQVEYPID